MIYELVICALSAFISWLITHCYHKKSIKNQEESLLKVIDEWKSTVSDQYKSSHEAQKLKYLYTALKKYKEQGSPVKVIDTFDIPESEKSDIYDKVMLIAKGRLGKSNPYKK